MKTIIFIFILPCFSIGAYSQDVLMNINGVIHMHHEGEVTPDPGTMRWSECDYEVWNGTDWVSLTSGKQNSRFLVSIGGINDDYCNQISVDQGDNIYMTGGYRGLVQFGDSELNSGDPNNSDIYITKFDRLGNILWAKSAGGNSFDSGQSIASDNANNVYITGNYNDTAYFDNTTLIENGGSDIFVAKYGSNGDLIWAKSAGGGFSDGGKAIEIDTESKVVVGGNFQAAAFFYPGSVSSMGEFDLFIAKLEPDNGNTIWVKNFGGMDTERLNSIDIDHSNNIYATGYFYGTCQFENATIESHGESDIFIAKFDSDANLLWAKSGGGAFEDQGHSVCSDLNGNVYTVGCFEDSLFIQNDTLISNGFKDLFIIKMNSFGDLVWIKGFGGSNYDNVNSITSDELGNVYIAGSIRDSVLFDDNVVVSNGNSNAFYLKLDPNGKILDLKSGGSRHNDVAQSIILDNSRNVFIGGHSSTFNNGTNIFKFGPLESIGAGKSDLFLNKY